MGMVVAAAPAMGGCGTADAHRAATGEAGVQGDGFGEGLGPVPWN